MDHSHLRSTQSLLGQGSVPCSAQKPAHAIVGTSQRCCTQRFLLFVIALVMYAPPLRALPIPRLECLFCLEFPWTRRAVPAARRLVSGPEHTCRRQDVLRSVPSLRLSALVFGSGCPTLRLLLVVRTFFTRVRSWDRPFRTFLTFISSSTISNRSSQALSTMRFPGVT